MTMAKHATHMGAIRSTYKTLVGKPEGEKSCGRQWCKWQVNMLTGMEFK
jgi:hypothetical protein